MNNNRTAYHVVQFVNRSDCSRPIDPAGAPFRDAGTTFAMEIELPSSGFLAKRLIEHGLPDNTPNLSSTRGPARSK
jgi:hypothetical protein